MLPCPLPPPEGIGVDSPGSQETGHLFPALRLTGYGPWGPSLRGFADGASGKEPTCQCRRCKRCGFDPWVGKIPWRRTWQPTPVFLPGESHGQRSLVGYSPWGLKETDTAEQLSTHVPTHGQVSDRAEDQNHLWELKSYRPQTHLLKRPAVQPGRPCL